MSVTKKIHQPVRADRPLRHSEDVKEAGIDRILDKFEYFGNRWAPKQRGPRRDHIVLINGKSCGSRRMLTLGILLLKKWLF